MGKALKLLIKIRFEVVFLQGVSPRATLAGEKLLEKLHPNGLLMVFQQVLVYRKTSALRRPPRKFSDALKRERNGKSPKA